MRVAIVRHHREDSPGFVGDAFQALGAEVSVRLFPADGPLPRPDDLDHIVVLGAVSSVNDSGPAAPWIGEELAWLRQVDEAGVPVLGICFGAQALCAASGGRVEAAPRKEIGWVTVDSVDRELIPAGPWFEFHGDRCLPPPRARLLASNRAGVQAFTVGRNLAVQFHPEVDAAQLAAWLAAGGRAEAERAGHDPDKLLAETAEHEPAARERAGQLVASALRIAGPG
jgi:GMP synthase-like glutamine amidotransferase